MSEKLQRDMALHASTRRAVIGRGWWKGKVVDRQNVLFGHTAILRNAPAADQVLAQFDDINSCFGHGWHRFKRSLFVRQHKPSKGYRKFVRRMKEKARV